MYAYYGSLKFQRFLLIFLWWNMWNTYYFVTKNMHEVCFNNELMKGLLKM